MLNLRKSVFIAILGTFLLNNTSLQSLPPANLVGYPVAKTATVNLLAIGFLWDTFKGEASRQSVSTIFEKQDLILKLLEEINNEEDPKERKFSYKKLKFLLRKECNLYGSLSSALLKSSPPEIANFMPLYFGIFCWGNTKVTLNRIPEDGFDPVLASLTCRNYPMVKKFFIRTFVESLAGIGGSVYFLKKLDTWNIEQLSKFLVENHETLKEILTEDQTPQESLELLIEEHYKQAELPRSPALIKSGISCVGFLISKLIDNIFINARTRAAFRGK